MSRSGNNRDINLALYASKWCGKIEGISKNITSGMLRKYAQTSIDMRKREDKSKLLLHSVRTATDHYNRSDKLAARMRGELALTDGESEIDFSNCDDYWEITCCRKVWHQRRLLWKICNSLFFPTNIIICIIMQGLRQVLMHNCLGKQI